MIKLMGWIAAVLMPLWNIPLIVRISRRKSSGDISLSWTLGVFACVLLMLPAGLASQDRTFAVFSALNALLFAGVVIQVLRYRA